MWVGHSCPTFLFSDRMNHREGHDFQSCRLDAQARRLEALRFAVVRLFPSAAKAARHENAIGAAEAVPFPELAYSDFHLKRLERFTRVFRLLRHACLAILAQGAGVD